MPKQSSRQQEIGDLFKSSYNTTSTGASTSTENNRSTTQESNASSARQQEIAGLWGNRQVYTQPTTNAAKPNTPTTPKTTQATIAAQKAGNIMALGAGVPKTTKTDLALNAAIGYGAASFMKLLSDFARPTGELTMGENVQATLKGIPLQEAQKQKREKSKFNKVADWLNEVAVDWYESAQKNEAKAREGLGDVGNFLVSTGIAGTQMAGDLALNALVPGSGIFAMAGRAYGSGSLEAQANGLTAGQQQLAGLKSAAIETITEKLFGFGSKVAYGSGLVKSPQVIESAINTLAKTNAGRTALKTLVGANEEGLEEVLSDLLNPIADRLLGLDSGTGNVYEDLQSQQVLEDYLVGGILGLFGSGTQVISGETKKANEEQRASEQAQQDIVSKGLESAEGTHSRILAEEYNKILAESSKRGHRYLYDSEVNSLQTALDMESRQGSTPNANAFNTAQQAKAQQDTAMRMMGARIFANNDISSDIAKAVAGNAKSSASAQTTRSFTEVTSAISNSTQTTEQAQKLNATAKAVINGNEVSNSQFDALAENNSAMQAIAKYAGVELPTFKGTASEVRTAKRNWLKGISTATAQRIKQAQAQQAGKTAQRQTMPVVDYARKYGEEADKVVQAFSDGERIESNLFNAEFDAAYQLGKSGVDVDKAMAQKSIQDLSPSQRMVAYQMGVVKAKSNTDKRKAKVKSKGNVSFDGETYTERGKTKTLPAVNPNGLTQEQKASIEVIKKIAEVTGINFVFYESEANEQGRYTESNGMFKDNTIYLDINAAKQFITDKSAILRTASHELTHYIQKHSPAQYAELKAFIAKTLVENESLLGKGKTFDTLVANKAYTRGLSVEEATDEVIADACEMMLRDSKAVQTLAEENPTLFKTIRNWLREFCRKLRKAFEGVETAYTESTALLNELGRYTDELQRMWDNAFIDAVRSDFTEMENDAGDTVVLADNNGHAQLSVRTYDEGGREQLENYLAKRVKEGAITTAERDDMLSQMEAMYKICKDYAKQYTLFGQWSEAEVRTDPITGEPIFSVVKANGDYALNLDFSLVCKKRRTLDAVFNEMISQGIMDDFDMVERSIAAINDVIRENDFETACALCFVDTKRYRQAMVADSFVRIYNGLVRSMVKDGQKLSYFNFGEDKTIINPKDGIHTLADSELDFTKIEQFLHNPKYMPKAKKDGGMTTGSVEYRVAKLLKESPQDRKLLKRGDFMSTIGFDNVRQHNTRVLGLYNAKKGAGGPKATQSDVQYLSEILAQNKFNADSAYKVGGVRVQSFSDYIPRLCFDYVQMMGDLAAKQLPAHAYTKEPLFALQFGRTGMKINMSLVPEVIEGGVAPGLDKDGNYAWRDGQSFGSTVYGGSEEFVRKCYDIIGKEYNGQDRLTAQEGYELAMAIQNADGYHNNCGTIAVGVSNAHILKLIRDPNIRMVIPYHKSSLNHLVAVMTNVDKYVDYTKKQNTRLANGTKLESGDFNFNEALRRLGDAKAAADEYLAWCDEHNYIPKFEEFRNEENYYKLLEDFTCYDRDGNAAPQGAVQVNFPTADDAFGSMSDLIEMGLIEDTNLNAKQTAKVPEIVKQIKATLPELEQKWKDEANAKKKPKKVQKSERDAEYLELAKDPEANRDKLQAMVDEAAKKAGYDVKAYHGTHNFGRTKFNREGWSTYLTSKPSTAKSFSGGIGVRGINQKLDDSMSEKELIEYASNSTYMENLKLATQAQIDRAYVRFNDYGKAKIDKARENGENIYHWEDENLNSGIATLSEIRELVVEKVSRSANGGVYAMYAKLGNALTVNGNGNWYYEIPISGDMAKGLGNSKASTDQILRYADENGYDSVVYKDIREGGDYGNAGISTVYAVVKPDVNLKSADPVTYDDAGNVIPLSERFNAGNEDIRYSNRDAEYMDAYFDGDDDAMQRLVDEAAYEAGYRYKAYHHTENAFTVFDRNKARKNMDIQGFFFSADPDAESEYGSVRYDTYLKMENPYIVDSKAKVDAIPVKFGTEEYGVKVREWLQDHGYDSVIRKAEYYGAEADEYIVFEPSQIKSSDPITYADDEYGEGDPIPLSERFNAGNEDIRYSERDSDRELLSTALESVARTKTEKALIAQYKENLSTLEDRQRTLQQARKELSDARKAKDTARAKSLENTVETLAKSVNAADEKLLKLQATEPLRNVVKRARTEERRAAKVKRDEAVKKTKAQAAAQKKKELDRVREQRDKRIEQVKKHNDEVNRNKRERSNVTAEWHSIAKLGKRFQQLIDHPTQKDSGHAPVGICQSALKLCKCFEIADRKRVIGNVKGAINELKARYASIKDDSALGIFHEQEMYNVIDAVSNEINALDSTEALNAETLHKIVKMLKMLDRTMVNANKFISHSIDKTIAQAGREWAKEINDATPMLKGKIGQFLNWQLRPDTFFKRLSGFAKNSMGEQIQAMFTEGTEKKLKVQQDFYLHFKDLTERKEYLELGKYKGEDLVDVGLVDADGNSILVTRDMMLAIYKHLSSNDNFMAVAYGGLEVPDLADYYRGKSKSAYDKSVLSDCMDAHMWEVQTEIMRIKAMISATEDEMQKQALKESLAELEIEADLLEREAFNKVQEIYINIQEKLTEYERELLNASTRWMDKSADYINEETMRMYGIEKAKVDNYWPIHRDTNFINTDLRTTVNDINLENWGSLKERVQSHAPVKLTGFAFELDNHTRRMSDFVGYAAVQRDFSKLYNTKLPAMRSSLARIVQQKFGSDNWLFGQSGQSYIDEYISAVSGSVQNGDALSNLYGNLAQATLSINLRVAVSQLASIPTAAAEVGWGNVARGLGAGFKIAFSKTAKEELAAKDPWYFQRYRGEGGMVEIASMKDASNFIGRQWNKLARSKVGSKLVNWCQDFDAFATSMMWAMAEEQVKENGGKPGDSNYDRLVSNVYRDIIRKTQPNYTVTERSGLLREKRGGLKFLTMYKTQSNQNLNILYEASATLRKYKQDFANSKNGVTEEDIKEAQKAVAQGYTAVLIGGTLAFSILRFLANAIMHSLDNYRDDEDDITLMSILGGITKETVSAMAGMVAFGGQVYDFVLPFIEDSRYYGLSDSAFAALSNILKGGQRLITKDDTDFEDFYKVFKDISNVLGLPTNNVRKLVNGARYHIEDLINGEFLSYEAGVERSQAVMAGKILDAVRAGDTDTADELFADAVESSSAQEPEKAVKAKVKSALKDAYNAGEIDDAEAQKILQDYFGYDKNAAYFEMRNFSEDVSSTYSPLYDALESGNRSDIRKEINDLLAHGKEEKDIKQRVTGHYREAYRNGSNEERVEIRKAMYASGLWDSSDEIIALCNKWLESK